MSSGGATVTTVVVVELNSFADDQEGWSHFHDLLARYADGLVADMGLANAVEVDLKPSRPGEPPAAELVENPVGDGTATPLDGLTGERPADREVPQEPRFYRMWVGDRPLRVRIPIPRASPPTAAGVARMAQIDLFENRELFLTGSVISGLWGRWQDVHADLRGSNLPSEQAGELFSGLLRRCLSLDPGAVMPVPPDDAGPVAESAPELLERLMARRQTLGMRLFLNPEAAAALDALDGLGDFPDGVHIPFSTIAETVQLGLTSELGIPMPPLAIDADDTLGRNEFRLQVNDLRLPIVESVHADEMVVYGGADALEGSDVEFRIGLDPVTDEMALIVRPGHLVRASEEMEARGLVPFTATTVMFLTLARTVRHLAGAFVRPEATDFYLDILSNDYGALVGAIRQRFDLVTITGVFRRLIDEDVLLLDQRPILEALLALEGAVDLDQGKFAIAVPSAISPWFPASHASGEPPGLDHLAECARRSVGRQITESGRAGKGTLRAIVTEEVTESRLLEFDSGTVTDQQRAGLVEAVWDACRPHVGTVPLPVVLTNSQVRRHLRRAIEKELPALKVISYRELAPGTAVSVVGRIRWK